MDETCHIAANVAAAANVACTGNHVPIAQAVSRPSWLSEMRWTLVAVLLTLGTGGASLLLTSYFGRTWWLDDFQSQWLPGYLDIHRALHEGSYPLISSSSWFGGDLAGEYQYGVFSLAHLLIIFVVFQWKLGLLGTVVSLIAIYEAILASGAFRLARRIGLTVPNAMIASLAATLNGYTFYWAAQNWFPAMASFAWLPWAWWAMLVALDRRHGAWRFLPAALFVYLVVAAGWPFTVLMAGTVTVWLAARNWGQLRLRVWPLMAAWALGLALAGRPGR